MKGRRADNLYDLLVKVAKKSDHRWVIKSLPNQTTNLREPLQHDDGGDPGKDLK